ncbi:diacylglycerol kinase family protein [Staphylococcus chromogenes]|nr:diacylglycerol kinase [Staphylococcus chromogenes]PTG57430.1 diacylglycerol kinase [Staphylococcus chromogenes]PTG90264.1 diacylglycerol kinase [Staphylococcus chromogenes]RIM13795.1 diacylglycerol kinase family protein [Staphylococcus chromogenes]UXS74559.1 diacylglycerol kinase family protein [Staphylococcus chromogenes]
MIKRFKPAIEGGLTLLRKDANFLIHIVAAILVVILGVYFDVSKFEWFFLLIAIFSVLITEAINTAIEYAVDLTTEDYHIWAKHAKDIAAFSVLLASIFSIIIGLMIFLPRLF